MISCVVPVSPSRGKTFADAVVVRLGAHVGHGVDGERDVEARFIGLARGRLDAGAGGDAGDHHLGDALRLSNGFEIGAGERAPGPLGHHDVAGLLVQFGDEVGPAGRTRSRMRRGCSVRPGAPPATLTSTTGRSRSRKASASARARSTTSPIGWTAGKADDALLQVDDDQGGFRVERGQCHGFSSTKFGMGTIGREPHELPSIVAEPLEQFDGLRKLVLFLRRQTRLKSAGQPVLPRRAPFLDPFAAVVCEREEGLSSVRRVRRATHQACALQRGDDRAHRLRAHSLRPGKARRRGGTLLLQAQQHRHLGRCQVANMRLLAQSALQLAYQGAEFRAKSEARVGN